MAICNIRMLIVLVIRSSVILMVLNLICCQSNPGEPSSMEREILYVGTFTDSGAEGIYVYGFDRGTLSFDPIDTTRGLVSPSFITLSGDKKYLYSANRGGTSEYPDWGSVSAFKISNSGKLIPLNTITSYGVSPCHISIDRTNRQVFLSHYVSGNITSIGIDDQGTLLSLDDSIQHSGSSSHAERQQSPHIHSSLVSANNDILLVADLGTDKMYSYSFQETSGKLKLADTTKVAAGSGPRHFAFHPSKEVLYVVGELSSTVSIYQFQSGSGKLGYIDMAETLPADYQEPSTAADIQITPNGKFLYVSNRGHDSIAIFKLSQNGHSLNRVGIASSLGKQPRNLMIDQTGEFLFVANRNTNNIVVFRISQETGLLTDLGVELQVPTPVCMKMISI